MQMKILSENKALIKFNKNDLCEYGLSLDTIKSDSDKTRNAFYKILKLLKFKNEFDTSNEKVFIQIYPCDNGGCDIYITKLCKSNTIATPMKRKVKQITILYDMDKMLSVCREMFKKSKSVCAEIYFEKLKNESEIYYVITDSDNDQNDNTLRLRNELTVKYIKEHSNKLCDENAVEVMSRL